MYISDVKLEICLQKFQKFAATFRLQNSKYDCQSLQACDFLYLLKFDRHSVEL